MSSSFFLHFIICSLGASVAMLLVLLVKKVLKNHVSARWQYNMDFIFLILLAVPFVPSSLLSFVNSGNWLNALYFVEKTAANANDAVRGGTGIMYNSSWLEDFSLSVKRFTPEYLMDILMGIWIMGIISFAVFTLMCNRNLRLIKESMKPVEKTEILSLFSHCKAELGINRNIRFGTSLLVKTPITVGVIKTYIVLPDKNMTINDVRYALLHELAHCKNNDILVNSIMCLIQILYWFNPFVYFIFKEMRLDREIACDTSVLKLLPQEFHIDYGKTLLNFVSMLSNSQVFSFTTDMGGSNPQILKRINHIASYTNESWLLQLKSFGVFIITGLLILSQIPAISALAANNDDRYYLNAKNVVYKDLSSFFNGIDGSCVLYDMNTDLFIIHNREKSLIRVSPASTYKIFSGLIALDTGIIDIGSSEQSWDGTIYPYETWNKDQDLMSAMQNSVSWYFQELDKKVGRKVLDAYFTRLSYGNHDLSGGIMDYWGESTLRISPVEQVELLKSFFLNDTIFQTRHVNRMKDILRLSEKDGAVLSGKTGTGSINGRTVNGWFVGYVENQGNIVVFATNIQGKDNIGGSTAVQITLSILEDRGIY